MLEEEFPNVKFVEDVGLRDKDVITVGSRAIIRRNVHNYGGHVGDSNREEAWQGGSLTGEEMIKPKVQPASHNKVPVSGGGPLMSQELRQGSLQ